MRDQAPVGRSGAPASRTAREAPAAPKPETASGADRGALPPGAVKDALLAEVRSSRGFLYNTVIAQAQKIEASADQVTFTFLPQHRALREQLESRRDILEEIAARVAGRKIAVVAVQAAAGDAGATPAASPPRPEVPVPDDGPVSDAKREALATPVVRDLLDVFPAEIRNVEEL